MAGPARARGGLSAGPARRAAVRSAQRVPRAAGPVRRWTRTPLETAPARPTRPPHKSCASQAGPCRAPLRCGAVTPPPSLAHGRGAGRRPLIPHGKSRSHTVTQGRAGRAVARLRARSRRHALSDSFAVTPPVPDHRAARRHPAPRFNAARRLRPAQPAALDSDADALDSDVGPGVLGRRAQERTGPATSGPEASPQSRVAASARRVAAHRPAGRGLARRGWPARASAGVNASSGVRVRVLTGRRPGPTDRQLEGGGRRALSFAGGIESPSGPVAASSD